MRAVLSDIRYACRALAGTPAFTAVAVLILAVGIGLNTAVFSLINMVILQPLHGASRPGQLAALYANDRTRPGSYHSVSYPTYVDIRDRNQLFARTAGLAVTMVGLGEGEMTRRAFAFIVTSTLFPLFDARPTMGRDFLLEEETPGANRLVTILSDEYWRRTGADPDIVGKTIRINTQLFTVIGVAPRGFGGPTTLMTPAVWLPTGTYDLISGNSFGRESRKPFADRTEHSLLLYVRMKPAVSLDVGPGSDGRAGAATRGGVSGRASEPRSRGQAHLPDGDRGRSPERRRRLRVVESAAGHDRHRAGDRVHESGQHAAGPLDQPAPRDCRPLRAGRQPGGGRSPTVDRGARPLDRRQRRRPAVHLLGAPRFRRVARAAVRTGGGCRPSSRYSNPRGDAGFRRCWRR